MAAERSASARGLSVRRRFVADRLRGREGFTLVEALAAFVIMATLTVVVQRALVMAKTGLVRADERIAADRVARTLLAEPLVVRAEPGSRSGVTDGQRWTVTIEPIDLPTPVAAAPSRDSAASTPWRPVRVTIQVVALSGRVLDVETVRLAPGD